MRRLLLPSLLLLSACASAPPPRELPDGFALPARFEAPGDSLAAATAEAPVENWWEQFGDPALDSLVTLALERNYSLQAAAARLEASLAAAGIERSALWPQLDGSLEASRSQQVFVGLPIPGGDVLTSRSTSYRAGLGTRWELDLWGRIRKGASAAAADAEATAAEYAGAQLSLSAQATKAVVGLRAAREQVELARATRDAYQRTAELAARRYDRGLVAAVDIRLTRSQLASAQALLAQRTDEEQRARRRLLALLGSYPAGSPAVGEGLPDSLPPVPAGLPAALVGRRPDLVAAERRWAASDARAGRARRALLPSISLTGSAGRSSNELGDLLDGDFSVWSIAGRVLQPLFQGGRLLAQVDAADAQREAAAAQYLQLVLEAFAEVEGALEAEGHLRDQQRHLARVAEESAQAWRLAEERYGRGVGDLFSVLDSQRRALDARSRLIALRYARVALRADLHVALGGGFAGPDDMKPEENR